MRMRHFPEHVICIMRHRQWAAILTNAFLGVYRVFQKSSPQKKTFWNMFTSVKSFCVKFCKFVGNSYPRNFTQKDNRTKFISKSFRGGYTFLKHLVHPGLNVTKVDKGRDLWVWYRWITKWNSWRLHVTFMPPSWQLRQCDPFNSIHDVYKLNQFNTNCHIL